MEPAFPTLADGFSTTGPPGRRPLLLFPKGVFPFPLLLCLFSSLYVSRSDFLKREILFGQSAS